MLNSRKGHWVGKDEDEVTKCANTVPQKEKSKQNCMLEGYFCEPYLQKTETGETRSMVL